MKINSLLESQTVSSAISNTTTSAPVFGRDEDRLEETTTSGCMGSVANPVGKVRSRGSIFSGINTSEKFPNSKPVKEENLPVSDKKQKYIQAEKDVLKGADFDHVARVRKLDVEMLRKFVGFAHDKLSKGEYKLNRPNLEEQGVEEGNDPYKPEPHDEFASDTYYDDKDLEEARANTAGARAGLSKRKETKPLSAEEQAAKDKAKSDKWLEKERAKTAAKKGVSEGYETTPFGSVNVQRPQMPAVPQQDREAQDQARERQARINDFREKKQDLLQQFAQLGTLRTEMIYGLENNVFLNKEQLIDFFKQQIDDPSLTALEYAYENDIPTDGLIKNILRRATQLGISMLDVRKMFNQAKQKLGQEGVAEGPSEVIGLANFAKGGGILGGQSPADVVDARGVIEGYEDEDCHVCGGTGEGRTEYDTCHHCKGSGLEPHGHDDDDFDMPDDDFDPIDDESYYEKYVRTKRLEEEQVDENLRDWFKEKWVRFGPDGKIRGSCARGDDSEGKPKCLPQSKAHSLGKKGRASAAARKRREDPNPERSGKAINVNTKKKSNEGMSEGSLAEMDKSAPQPGRDGRVSHSTYGSRDKGGSKGPEKEAKPITAKKAKQDALDILKKQGVAEGLSKRDQQDVAAIRAAIERLESQLNQPNVDKAAIQQSIAHEKKRLALYGQEVAEADKHSMLGKIQRHQELKKKVDTSFADIGKAQKAGDHSTASKAFRKHERYANLERPGTWTKSKEQGVAEGLSDEFVQIAKDKFPTATIRKDGETIQEPPKSEVPAKQPVDIEELQNTFNQLKQQYQKLGGDSWQYADRMMPRDIEARNVKQQMDRIAYQIANAQKNQIDEAELSEEMLANELYKDLQIFKKSASKEISGKAKSKDLSDRPKDKEIISKVEKSKVAESVEVNEDLRKWFKEKWVRFGPDGKIRGSCARGDDSEGKPKCLPQSKAHNLGKEGRKYAASKKRREDPNPERRGPAKNVATKKKSNEGVAEGEVVQFKQKNPLTPNLIKQLKALSQQALELFWEGSYMPTAAQGQVAQLGKNEEQRMFKQNEAQFQALGYEYSINEESQDILYLHSIAREAWYDANKPANMYRGLPDLMYNAETNTLSYYDLIGDDGYEYTDTRQFESLSEEQLDELKCWPGYSRVRGVPAGAPGSCKKKTNEEELEEYGDTAKGQKMLTKVQKRATDRMIKADDKRDAKGAKKNQDTANRAWDRMTDKDLEEEKCPHCGGAMFSEMIMNEKKDACYYKVKSRYKVWPSAYASGALVKCRKKGADNWGNKSK